jgi:hypothetical protein
MVAPVEELVSEHGHADARVALASDPQVSWAGRCSCPQLYDHINNHKAPIRYVQQ